MRYSVSPTHLKSRFPTHTSFSFYIHTICMRVHACIYWNFLHWNFLSFHTDIAQPSVLSRPSLFMTSCFHLLNLACTYLAAHTYLSLLPAMLGWHVVPTPLPPTADMLRLPCLHTYVALTRFYVLYCCATANITYILSQKAHSHGSITACAPRHSVLQAHYAARPLPNFWHLEAHAYIYGKVGDGTICSDDGFSIALLLVFLGNHTTFL